MNAGISVFRTRLCGHASRGHVGPRKAILRELDSCQWTAEVVSDHADHLHLTLCGAVGLTATNGTRPERPSGDARDATASKQQLPIP